ncbi:unnamed protein product [Allacma fusca]|uniref:Uncharacterized protein n=1 Tax=Allacma fusca TaxID=39272 RepID=A0A8J2JS65_9HEXA|nr:unnamed protein product [Allacma fusca]
MFSPKFARIFVICAIFGARKASAGTTLLNAPQLQTTDLRRIDGFVSSTLPIYPKGFQLYTSGPGARPIIVKMIDPERMSAPLPNPGYYTNLPAVIPQGLEGIARTSFILGSPLVSGVPQNSQLAQSSVRVENSLSGNVIQYEGENIQARSNLVEPEDSHRNSVVEATAQYEASLPGDLRNPFYSNQQTAESLARESLPTQGEQVVTDWNTRKIQDGKIRDLLSSAGLINAQQ